jgi:hypothetical protein
MTTDLWHRIHEMQCTSDRVWRAENLKDFLVPQAGFRATWRCERRGHECECEKLLLAPRGVVAARRL